MEVIRGQRDLTEIVGETAVYGPVRTVVWEDGGREASSYPIPIACGGVPFGRPPQPQPLIPVDLIVLSDRVVIEREDRTFAL